MTLQKQSQGQILSLAAEPPYLPRWLATATSPGQMIPATRKEAQETLNRLSESFQPATAKQRAIALDYALAPHIDVELTEDSAGAFLEALEGIPADLLHAACRHVRLYCKYKPKPAHFLEAVKDDIAERNIARMRLESALKNCTFKDDQEKRQNVSKEEISKLMEAMRKNINSD